LPPSGISISNKLDAGSAAGAEKESEVARAEGSPSNCLAETRVKGSLEKERGDEEGQGEGRGSDILAAEALPDEAASG
jgi:hypothetical protein